MAYTIETWPSIFEDVAVNFTLRPVPSLSSPNLTDRWKDSTPLREMATSPLLQWTQLHLIVHHLGLTSTILMLPCVQHELTVAVVDCIPDYRTLLYIQMCTAPRCSSLPLCSCGIRRVRLAENGNGCDIST